MELQLEKLLRRYKGGLDAKQIAEATERERNVRLAVLERARRFRPYSLPIVAELDGVAARIRDYYSDPSDDPLIITGAYTNIPSLQIKVATVADPDRGWSKDLVDVQATAAVDPASTGNHDLLDDFVPFELAPRNKMILTIKNPSALTTNAYYVFSALKVLPGYDAEQSAARDSEAAYAVNSNKPQRSVVLKLNVPYTSAAAATLENLESEEYDEPLLVVGLTTKLKNSLIRFSDSSGVFWSPKKVPIWSIAGHLESVGRVYRRFKVPFLLSPNSKLRADVTNGINGVFDAAADINLVCRTP